MHQGKPSIFLPSKQIESVLVPILISYYENNYGNFNINK